MKKYNVENLVASSAQYRGEEPWPTIAENWIGDYIEANTEEEAVDLAMFVLSDRISDSGSRCEINNGAIVVYNEDGEVFEYCYDFRAKEVR